MVNGTWTEDGSGPDHWTYSVCTETGFHSSRGSISEHGHDWSWTVWRGIATGSGHADDMNRAKECVEGLVEGWEPEEMSA